MAVSKIKQKAIKEAHARGITVPLIASLTGLKGKTVRQIVSKKK